MDKKIIIIFGQMAVGKTDISIKLAKKIGGEIILADSLIFYRGFDIGINKPSKIELSQVPHHLVDIADPNEIIILSEFLGKVQDVLSQIILRGKTPLIVGGTGLYIRLLVEKLSGLNANTISSKLVSNGEQPIKLILVGIRKPHQEHYALINSRIEKKFMRGFVNEVKKLLAQGYSPGLPTMSAIGYKECVDFIQGRLGEEQAKKELKRMSRIYVRRQSVWFTEKDPIRWFDAGENCVSEIEEYIIGYN